MAEDALDELRRLVIDDRALRDRLLAASDRDTFVARVIALAREHGIALTPDAVAVGLDAARHERMLRWV
jgi:hypothetical protein